jgi:hypothetical protein
MSCPSTSFNETCSGHGICQYLNLAGQSYPEPCLVTNVYCKATCLCDTDYGGTDCSLSSEALLERDSNRATMCNAITTVSEFTDPSSNLLGSMINSLFISYLSEEVIVENTVNSCANALTNVSALAQNGYLVGTDLVVQSAFVYTVSNYVVSSPNGKTAYLDSVVSDMTNGLFHTLKNGEIPKKINSPNIQISLQKAFVPMFENAVLSAPSTESDVAYEAEIPSFQIVESSLEECVTHEGFSHFSLMQWGNNPFPNASSIHSPMLRFSGNFHHTNNAPTDSAYFISLPFTEEQNFNLNISVASINAHSVYNIKFPNCTIFEDGHYVSCGNCEISTYTNRNVTFFCKNIRNLCQAMKNSPNPSHRYLVGDDDYFSDDSVEVGSGISAEQYGALIEAVGEQFLSILSANPFHVSIEEAKVIVSLVGSLVIVFLIGSIFFTAWDTSDRIQFIYGETWPPTSGLTTKTKSENKAFDSQKLGGRKSSFTMKKESVSTMSTDEDEPARIPIQRSESPKLFSEQVVQFFDLVVPTIFHSDPKKGWSKVFQAVLIRHDYTSVFFHSSSEKNRFMRWMDLYNAILNGLFISTLFYGTFYSNSGQCEGHLIENDCTSLPNKITGEAQCSWDKESQTCSLKEPPANFSFTIIIALTCTLIGVPLQFFIAFLLDEYCNKRPRLEDIGLSTEYWVGVGVRTTPTEINYEKKHEKKSHSSKFTLPDFEKGRESEIPDNNQKINISDSSKLAFSYDNLLTAEEELERIFWLIRNYYSSQQTVQFKTFLANLDTTQLLLWKETNDAKRHEILKNTGLNTEEEFLPLPIYEYLLYSCRRSKTISELENVREMSQQLMDQLEELATVDQASLQDVLLLYSFILEQFPTFKRWILKDQLLCFEGFFPSVIGFYPWFFAWTFVLAVYLFYCYWIFAWGIANGSLLLQQWGLNFAIGAIQDILFIQIAKILILYFIALFSIKPQLEEIKQTLINTAINMNHGSSKDPFSRRKFFSLALFGNSHSLEANRSLFPSIFDHNFTMIQFMSPTCRVAWKEAYRNLFLAKILRQLDDFDAVTLRKETLSLNRNTVLNYLIVFVPLVMIFCGAVIAELLLDTVFPTVVSGIIVANYYLSTLSPTYVIILWIGGVGLLLFYYYVWKHSSSFAVRHSERKRNQKQSKLHNMILKRTKSSSNLLEYLDQEKKNRSKRDLILSTNLFTVIGNIGREIQSFFGKLRFNRFFHHRRQQKESLENNVWQKMNLPMMLHGKCYVLADRRTELFQEIFHHMDEETNFEENLWELKAYLQSSIQNTANLCESEEDTSFTI